MSILTDRIKSDAATWLELPPGTHPKDALERYQKFLRLETHRLKLAHRRGADGREVCTARALAHDLLFTSLLRAVETLPGSPTDPPPCALVAVGGYGRAELSPASDVDILFLHDKRAFARNRKPAFTQLLDPPILFTLFPKTSPIVRTLDECVREANKDLRTKTSMLEARLVWGDAALFATLQKAILDRCINGQESAYIAARLEDQAVRRSKYGNTVCLQEPNIKNGCGGLRDRQNLSWMALVKYRNLDQLHTRGLVQPDEMRRLDNAYNFLLRVRNELHYYTERPTDQLTKSVQPFVAHNLGYHERSLSRRLEQFMHDYYQHAQTIFFLTRTLEQRLSLLPQPQRLPSLSHFLRERRKRAAAEIDGFKIVDGLVFAASDRTLADDPARLMRVFRHAQQQGVALHPDLAQLVHNHAQRLPPKFREDPAVHRIFLEILGQRGNVAPTLRAMHEVGLLGAFLPPFGKLTCLVQHEFFHQYTADEHTLVCLEKLDAIANANPATGPLAPYTEIFQKRIDRPALLYLALLLHDAGKAHHTPDHSESGSRIATSVARRLGLDATATHTLRTLVRHHLLMVVVSQRRDLDEPAELRHFAQEIQSLEVLHLLTLLTIADSLGTSDQLWNGFKDTLLLTLYRRTSDLLATGTEFARAELRQRQRLAADVRRQRPPEIAEEEIDIHFQQMPPRYFLQRTPADILTDLDLAHRFLARALSDTEDPLEPVISWQHEPQLGYSRVHIATWDRPALFSRICGAFTAAGLNILSAAIFTRNDNIALDSFYVTDTSRLAPAQPKEQDRFARHLRDALCDGRDIGDLIPRQTAKLREPASTEPIPTLIRFDNESADTRTVLEISTADKVGLLYTISQTLADLGVDISTAKIATERRIAQDTFYLSETTGAKIQEPRRQTEIQRRLRSAIARL